MGSLGWEPGVAGLAGEPGFLFALGVVYAAACRLVESISVLHHLSLHCGPSGGGTYAPVAWAVTGMQ